MYCPKCEEKDKEVSTLVHRILYLNSEIERRDRQIIAKDRRIEEWIGVVNMRDFTIHELKEEVYDLKDQISDMRLERYG
jgi:hypothetical protein